MQAIDDKHRRVKELITIFCSHFIASASLTYQITNTYEFFQKATFNKKRQIPESISKIPRHVRH